MKEKQEDKQENKKEDNHKEKDNIIQGLWIGDKLSRFEYNSIKSYIKQGYQYHLYTYGEVNNIPEGVIIKDGNNILDKKHIFYYEGSIAPFSDLFRYKLLFEKGGIWTDCDIICINRLPIDKQHKYIFVAERTILKGAFASCMKTPPYTCKKKKVLNSFIKCPAGSEIMRIMYEKSLKYKDDYLSNFLEQGKKNNKNKITQKNKNNINKSNINKSNINKNNINKSLKSKVIHIEGRKNIGLKSYHWGGGSKTLEGIINKMGLEKYIVEPEFAFPINWWDFKHAFLDTQYIPPTKGWEKGTHIDNIFKKHHGIYLVVIHNGWMKNHNVDKNAKYPENSLFERLDRYINY